MTALGQISSTTDVTATSGVCLAPGAYVQRAGAALNTVYQPSTTRPTLVLARVRIDCNANDEEGQINVQCDAANPPTVVVTSCLLRVEGDAVAENPRSLVDFALSFIVPANFFYRLDDVVNVGTPGFSVQSVYELTL